MFFVQPLLLKIIQYLNIFIMLASFIFISSKGAYCIFSFLLSYLISVLIGDCVTSVVAFLLSVMVEFNLFCKAPYTVHK